MMAETKEMVVPLRAAWAVPRTQRAARAIKEIRKHVSRHMKVKEEEEIWIDERSIMQFGPVEFRNHLVRFVLLSHVKKDSQLKSSW